MLDILAKLAARSAQIRQVVIEKDAGLIGAAINNPVATLATVAGTATAVNKTKQHKAGFNPNVQQAMLGQPPIPPTGN